MTAPAPALAGVATWAVVKTGATNAECVRIGDAGCVASWLPTRSKEKAC
jgi:hypothetical protein